MTTSRRCRTACLAAGVFLTAPAVHAQVCDAPQTALAASRDLYCATLVPAPGLESTSGVVELGRIPGPFTVTVTPDGRPVYAAVITTAGLPTPGALGHYTTYVAWVTTPTMYPTYKLGTLRNGRNRLGRIELDPFIILITAEPSGAVRQPTGRVILRGGSPSTRLLPPDLLQFSVGAVRESTSGPDGSMDHAMTPTMSGMATVTSSVGAGNGDSARWTTVPMVPGMIMLPSEMALSPAIEPYLPRPKNGEQIAAGRPRSVVHLTDGDTLHLTAGLVRRTVRGRAVTMYAFNGQYPGPLLSVRQGAQIVVDFQNHLDQPTTVHWHGIRLDSQFDGVPDLSQQPVVPGGHFVYHVRFPDAGIYWYHPHVREDAQQGLGLYGNLLVRSPRADYFSPAHREEELVLDDLLMNDEGLVPFGRDAVTHAFMGRFGNVLLVNGEPRYTLSVRRGEVVRFYVTNVSNTRTYNLSFPGARMKIVGSDAGNFLRESWAESVVIAPAERYIVQVRFPATGTVPLVNRVRGLDHLFGRFVTLTDTLGAITVARESVTLDLAASFRALRTDSGAAAEIEPYRRYFDRPVDRTLVLTLQTHDLPFVTRQLMQFDSAYFTPVEWSGTMPSMNWASTTNQIRWVLRDPATGKENMDIGWTFRRGDVIKLRLINDRLTLHGMQHPIHIHGQRFLVLAVNGVPNDDLAWKDTVLVPAGAAVDILVDLSNPGRWMLHCHIAEHLAAQMMTAFTVN